jgi:excisionase family DNA binding protein
MSYLNISKIHKELTEIRSLINVTQAEFIGIDEASKHLGLSKTYIYSLVQKGKLPFYKPNGKKIYFNKLELNEWISKSRVKSSRELAMQLFLAPLRASLDK